MAIYDWNGSASSPLSSIYDWNGAASTPFKSMYDWNGSASSLIYSLAPNPLYLYSYGTKSQYGITPFADQSYANREVTENGETFFYLVPWCAGVASDRRGSSIRTTQKVDVTPYKNFTIVWKTHRGYGDAYANDPRCTWYLSSEALVHGYNTDKQIRRAQVDTNYTSKHTQSMSISDISGSYYLFVSNWSADGTSGVYLYQMYLTY